MNECASRLLCCEHLPMQERIPTIPLPSTVLLHSFLLLPGCHLLLLLLLFLCHPPLRCLKNLRRREVCGRVERVLPVEVEVDEEVRQLLRRVWFVQFLS